MPLSALLLVLTAAVLHASWNIVAKRAGGDHRFTLITGLLSSLVWLPAGLWFGWDEVPRWGALQWAVAAASAGVHLLYFNVLPRLLAAGAHLPGLHDGDAARVALEAYPGLLAFELIGRRSYKNSHDGDRLIARKDMVHALEQGRTRLGLRLKLTPAQADALVADASGDHLDAVLCLLQAAWALGRPGYGLHERVDPVEGWITTA